MRAGRETGALNHVGTTRTKSEGRLPPLAPGLAVAALALHLAAYAWVQGPWCIDDAYISFRYAQNLADGLGLVWNAGEQVDGYTNFAWVLLLSPIEALGLDTPFLSRCLNACAAVAVVLVMWRLASRRFGAGAGVLPAFFIAMDGAFAHWGQDGLETTAFALVLLLASGGAMDAWESEGASLRVPMGFALLTLLRPEGGLHFGVTLLFGLLSRRQTWRAAGRWAAAFTAVVLPWFLWRWSYYGYPLPNTFYVKVGMTPAQIARGLDYVWAAFGVHRLPATIVIIASVGLKRGRRGLGYLFCLVGAHLAFVVAVGGDWMGPGRFIVPILPLAYLACGVPISTFGEGPRRALVAAGLALALTLNFWVTSSLTEMPWVSEQRAYLASRDALARWLNSSAGPEDTILAGEIGQLGYVTGRVVYDVFGLVDSHIAHLDVPIGAGKPGHEKTDLAYSLGLHPTWFVLPPRGLSPSGYHEIFVPPATARMIPLPKYRRLLRADLP